MKNIKLEKIMESPLYQRLQDRLNGVGLTMAQKKELEIAKREQRELVQRLEADKQI